MNCAEVTIASGCHFGADQRPMGSVLIHTEYRPSPVGGVQVHAVRYTDANGAPITLLPGESVAPGACSVDTTAAVPMCDGGVPFLRHIHYDAEGNPAGSVDTALDGVTAYTPVGAVQPGVCYAVGTPGAAAFTGTATVSAPTALVLSLTLVREVEGVEFSADGGATWVLMSENGSRTWHAPAHGALNVAQMRFRGVAPGSSFELLWEA
jgi:3',5'-cyclic AMP phosphodiesterase CpdA